MSDDLSTALSYVAAQTPGIGAEPRDRITVRDYVVSVEIGAFASERGVTQRIRFNVVLEVVAHTAAHTDDVDKVLSYDTIVAAIDAQLSTERVNLLETLAERVAERCLEDARAVRCFVRIEKLDRIPGALGVEIERRRRGPALPAIGPDRTLPEHSPVMPMVVALGPQALKHLPAWIAAVQADERPVILVLPASGGGADVAGWPGKRIALLGIEQRAWRLAADMPDCVVVASRTEVEHCAATGTLALWAPSKIVTDAVPRPSFDVADQAALAAWFAAEIGAPHLLLAGLDAASDGPVPTTIALAAMPVLPPV